MLVLGNIFSLIGALAVLRATFSRSKQSVVKLQIVECVFYTISNICLGGVSGAVVSFFALAINILVFLKVSSKLVYIILILLTLIVGVGWNNTGVVGLLPVASSVMYSTVMCRRASTVTTMKRALLISTIEWMVYDFTILAVPSLVSDIIILGSIVFNLLRERKGRAECITTVSEVVHVHLLMKLPYTLHNLLLRKATNRRYRNARK